MDLLAVLAATVVIFGIGFFVGSRFTQNLTRTSTEEKDRMLENQLKALASDALKSNSESFLQLAEQKFKNLHQHSDNELEKREKAIENLVKPIHDALTKTGEQIQQIEKQRKEEYGSLHKQIEMTMQAQQDLREETGKLVQALRQPQVRGRWGEMTLRRLAELAGMVEHCDFEEQVSVANEQGAHLRPDMIIRMPNNRIIIVDAKTPINAYLEAMEAENDAQRDISLDKHAQNINDRMKELSAKSYWQQFEDSLDFVILFIPGDQFLTAALQKRHDLIEQAMNNKIILATPSSLVALLRAVAFGWREKSLAENAAEVQKLGSNLLDRIGVFIGHFSELGKRLNQSVERYNQAQISMESRLLGSAQKLSELGVPKNRELPETKQIETRTKAPSENTE